MTNFRRTIFVDADACPVKDEIIDVATSFNLEVIFVASYAHMTTNQLPGQWVYVDTNKEEVDLYITNHIKKDDVAVTQDIGLASLLLSKKVHVISPRGKQYAEENMDQALFSRYLSAKQRRAGYYSKGPSAFSNKDREFFIKTFKKMLSKLEG
ncbi:YaiI/YqxD family protein [Bacillus sp. Marseille-P3661]|uniref:YaiI/YqxD family protein n=1 Tax=Bacillus sp. Marseille-P3661 TaxID=1936234 RepID=UPI000C81F6CD|nr:YaiI/YqxD family protein [Bacillus sp. Marseille-P3661]